MSPFHGTAHAANRKLGLANTMGKPYNTDPSVPIQLSKMDHIAATQC